MPIFGRSNFGGRFQHSPLRVMLELWVWLFETSELSGVADSSKLTKLKPFPVAVMGVHFEREHVQIKKFDHFWPIFSKFGPSKYGHREILKELKIGIVRKMSQLSNKLLMAAFHDIQKKLHRKQSGHIDPLN